MKKSDRLKPVKELAENRVKDAAINMSKSAQAYQESLQQLEKLVRYREDYIVQFKTKGRQGIPAARLIEYQAFVQKIDQAIELQKQNVEKARYDVGDKQASLQSTHNRKKAMDKVIDKSRHDEHSAEQNHEQKDNDDRSRQGLPSD